MEKNCPVCLSVKVRQEPFYYLFDNRKWCLYRCKKCSHQFILPFFKREEQIKIYNDFYFSSNGDWACGIYKKGYIESEVELRKEAKEILEMFPINKGKLLEIGCAGGFFLDEARKKGFIVEGIEPNPRMSSYAKP